MKQDILLSGVGGQGVISMASIIGLAAVKQGLAVRQSEIHGMAQRGGIVQVHLRIADKPIESDLIPKKSASFIISMEPLESLRCLDYLDANGIVITSLDPVLNIVNYPEQEYILKQIQSVPRYAVINTKQTPGIRRIARSLNIMLVGAASKRMTINKSMFEEAICEKFKAKGESVIRSNMKAFYLGRDLKWPVNIN